MGEAARSSATTPRLPVMMSHCLFGAPPLALNLHTDTMTIASPPAHSALAAEAARVAPLHLRTLFAADPQRFAHFSLRHGGLLLDFSKQRLDAAALAALHAFAVERDVTSWLARLQAGKEINHTEHRAVLHMALRADREDDYRVHGTPVAPRVQSVLARIADFCERVHDGSWRGYAGDRITDVVNLGIGGSDLGPRMVVHALTAWQQPDLKVHFVANVDGADLANTLAGLNPRTTLFIVASKTFTTQETMTNAHSARAWLQTATTSAEAVARHFVAVSTNLAETSRFGIAPENVFEFWDWVGGRFSLWSAVGLSIALAVGFHNFSQLLAGAHDLDQHFLNAPPTHNLPLTLALIGYWNSTCLGAASHAVLPYSQSLERLPDFLQQLEMESNGKQVDRVGQPLAGPACPILWGSAGTNGQHSFYQLLHQGGRLVSCDFIALRHADFPLPVHHEMLLANCLAQSAALAFGQNEEEVRAAGVAAELVPYKVFPGNQPSTTLLLDRLTPFSLGQLLALYEHKVFVQGVLWNINSFDQWGVELGKQLAGQLLPVLQGHADVSAFDASTRGLVQALGEEQA
jgi:glucose-6-phosphate isomerase